MADPTGNEPAAPVVKTTETVERVTAKYRGLSKREHFAGLAMQGILAGLPQTATYDRHETARIAIAHADALIAELARGAE